MQEVIGKPKTVLDTPCLVIDKDLLISNLRQMQDEVNSYNKNLRPHVKTHKCLEICKLQIETGAIGISAAKVSEALVLALHGFKNTLITSPVVTETKIKQLMRCYQYDPTMLVVVDNFENAQLINHEANKLNLIANILIDVDPNVGRTGIAFSDVVSFARDLKRLLNLRLLGIQCYAGNLQHISDYKSRINASTQIMQKAADCIHELRNLGLGCEILTGSGTGTYAIDLDIPLVTEVQPGSYTVMDSEYQNIAFKKQSFQPAMKLLTTVISVNQSSHVTCDAGWKSLYEVATKPIISSPAGFTYEWFGDEHGKILPQQELQLPKLGDRLELIVAHCDPTINMHDVFYVTENGIVTEVWPIEMRGKSQ